ncbi:rubredoxin-like domain-containing protein [Desulfonema magnum]|uniref:Rubredoxin-like domain-containing protein n=1 Tax=Desulfonema magnum TaxID=45655 RepID=A0A975GLJ4_9BACT|nr:DUF2231 domain-containing protein [Desulfonema magnum]QTA85694.1 rubredoxin-like domain-containing protein [Desulfonema magnum]
MKTWKCTVCGYIQRSEEPPEKCPVCGVDRSMFIEIFSESAGEPEPKSAISEPESLKTWECTVCAYTETGNTPPDECPVCGSDRSKFEETLQESDEQPEPESASIKEKPDVADSASAEMKPDTQEKPEPAEPESAPAEIKADTQEPVKQTGKPIYLNIYDKITGLMTKYHIHPISVHTPNGVLPAAVIFVFLAVIFQAASFGEAAFYNLVFVLLSMPLVLFSGYNDWKRIYGGNLTSVFYTKMVCGGVVFFTSLILVIWYIINPDVVTTGSRWAFLFIHLIMLAAAGIAGHLGGKLVFAHREN